MSNKSHTAAISNNLGELGEAMARAALAQMGYTNIKKGRGKWHVTGWINRAEWIARVVADPEQKNSPDWQAIEPTTGRAVWAEVKARVDRLPYSALKDHQRSGLDNHKANNGIALLVWVNPSAGTVAVLNWPVTGFEPGSSLSMAGAFNQAVYVNGFDQLLAAELVTAAFDAAFPPPEITPTAQGFTRLWDYTNRPATTAEKPAAPNWQLSGEDRPCPECRIGRMVAANYGDQVVYICGNCNMGEIEAI